MFNLDKAIELWKNEFKENDSFTNEDIEELEGHLLDKIDSLTKSGLTQEEAFIKANENIGTVEVLHNDFSTVNKIGILTKRMILGVFGYVFIVFLTNVVRIITTLMILPFSKNLVNILVSKYSLSGMTMSLFIGDEANKLMELSIIISSLISLILIYILVSNKFNIINKINEMVNKNIYNKSNLSIPKIIIIMTVLTVLVAVTPSIGNIIGANGNLNEIGSISYGTSISKGILDLILLAIFIYKLCSKSKVSKSLFISLGGYFIGNILLIIIPTIVENIIFNLDARASVLKYMYITMYLLVTAMVTFIVYVINKKAIYKKKNNKNFNDRKFIIRISVGVILAFIYYGLNLVIIQFRFSNIDMIRLQEFVYIEQIMKLVIILIAQFIVSIILIRKIRIYRKVA